MRGLRATLVVLSSLLLAAHLLRAGWMPVALVAAATPLLLLARGLWPGRLVQIVLALGVLEWLRTLLRLLEARRALSLPAGRLTVILLAVAAFTAVSALALRGWRGGARAGEAG